MVRHLEGLLTGITDYWFPAALDRWRGGFRAPDPAERPLLDRQVRTTVQQARHTWFLARLARSPYGDERHLAAATHGVQYLRTRLWDDRHGGFVWGIRPRGRVVDGHKHAYAQAFAVLALSEYARAAGDAEALDLAATTLDVLDEVARDDDGYAEVHGRDWGPCVGGPMQGAGARTLNTHLHLLEAVLAFIAAGGDGRDRLALLEEVLVVRTVRADGGGCHDVHDEAWRPVGAASTSYGHDLETVWLLDDAGRTLGRGPGARLPVLVAIGEHALAHGVDHVRGGVFASGPPGAPAARREKLWWVQAEALLGLHRLHELTGERRWWTAFEQTLGWILAHQVHPGDGGWHTVVREDGVHDRPRASAWKTPYHDGRAVLELLASLSTAAEAR